MSWYVDHGLAVLIEQLRRRFPGIVIGTIGDASHQGGTSDHNPEADGSVDAADPMIGDSFSKNDCEWLFDTLHNNRDHRIAYVIYNRRIFSSTVSPWKIRDYNGNDPHTGHLHISVNDKHENDTSPWRLEQMKHTYESLDGYSVPILNQGDNDRDFIGPWSVSRAQDLLRITPDGDYGPDTAKAVRSYMGTGTGRTIDLPVWIKLLGLVGN